MMLHLATVLGVVLAADVAGGASRRSQHTDGTDGFSAAYQACITYGETHDTTAIPAAECNARELRVQDDRLNATYKTVMARLPPARKAALRSDERKWIVARDRTCDALPDVDLATECRINATIERIEHLRGVR